MQVSLSGFPRLILAMAAMFPLLGRAQETASPQNGASSPSVQSNTYLPEDQAPDGEVTDDPFSDGVLRGVPAERGKQPRQALRIRLETWEAPALEVTRRLDGLQSGASLEQLRTECLNGGEQVRLVFSPLASVDTSTRMTAESITERIYATEYEPPAYTCPPPSPKPEAVENPVRDLIEGILNHSVPTAFETRNTGQTFQAVVQPVEAVSGSWDMIVSFESVEFVGMEPQGAKALGMSMPIYASFRTGGLVRLKEGQWRLLSVMEPPRGAEGKASDKRWITILRIDPEG